MKRFLYLIVWLAVAAVIGFAAQMVAHISFWIGFAIAAVSMFINGVIAEIEDRATGGFYNPKEPKDRG
jgi:hypothetical protein